MIELKGSEKQIKWAEEIREDVVNGFKNLLETYKAEEEISEKMEKKLQIYSDKVEQTVFSINDARDWIFQFKDYRHDMTRNIDVFYNIISELDGLEDQKERMACKKATRKLGQKALEQQMK